MKVAVLGLGRMGQAIAGRLLEGGHEVAIWNRSPGRANALAERGAEVAGTLEQAASGAEVVLTCLSDDEAVRQLALGPLRQALKTATYVDCSTVSPALSAELEGAFDRFVAAPILGAPKTVAAGQAVVLAGGTGLEAAGPLLSALSSNVRRYERAAMATTAKVASNSLLLAGVVAVAEALAIGRGGGLDDAQLRELFGTSPLVAPALANRFEGIVTGELEGWWTSALGAKDARLAVAVAESAGLEVPSTDTVRRRYEEAVARGLGDEDIVAVARLYGRAD